MTVTIHWQWPDNGSGQTVAAARQWQWPYIGSGHTLAAARQWQRPDSDSGQTLAVARQWQRPDSCSGQTVAATRQFSNVKHCLKSIPIKQLLMLSGTDLEYHFFNIAKPLSLTFVGIPAYNLRLVQTDGQTDGQCVLSVFLCPLQWSGFPSLFPLTT